MGFVGSILSRSRGMMNSLGFRRPWEKVLCSGIVGGIMALSTNREFDSILDTSVMVFVYCCWIFFSLPYLHSKLTIKLITDFATVLMQFFVAEIAIFGLYSNLKRYISGKEAVYNSMEQRGYMFVMNFIRVVVIAYCLLRSFKKFWTYWRKAKPSKKGGEKRRSNRIANATPRMTTRSEDSHYKDFLRELATHDVTKQKLS